MFAHKSHSQHSLRTLHSQLTQGARLPAARVALGDRAGHGSPCAGRESGFAALALLFMLAGVGALSLAHLSKVVAEHKQAM